jgi:hypothetical protein
MNTVEAIAPGEDIGRDTISRFDMQFQAAAYAALEILKGSGVDCVYCDYHDDFVVRKNSDGRIIYHFFQVKTKNKENHQWSLAEIFSLKKRGQKNDKESLGKVRSSFAGKLLVHGIIFGENCIEATLLSNVHFSDDVVTAVDELRGKSPQSNAAKFLNDNFSAIFAIEECSDTKVGDVLSKISLLPAVRYIGKDRESFTSAARSAIFDYSEIDLSHYETQELANGLVDLVYRKSKGALADLRPEDISQIAGVRLDDLLAVLSISTTAYEALLAGEDPKALKSASVIQRWYKKAGADDQMIEFVAQQKVNWDIWLRAARHIYTPFDLTFLLERLDKTFEDWQVSGANFKDIPSVIDQFSKDSFLMKFEGLDHGTLFGAINSVLVRKYSK